MNGIIFDFDGPLFDGRKAAERALATTAAAFRDVVGPNPPSLVRLPLLSPIQVLAALLARLNMDRASFERIVEHYAAEIGRQESEIE